MLSKNSDPKKAEWLVAPEVIFLDDKILKSEDYIHLTDLRIIQYTALTHGYDITIDDAHIVWTAYSDDFYFASYVDEDLCNLDAVWDKIKHYFGDDFKQDVCYFADKSIKRHKIDFIINRENSK